MPVRPDLLLAHLEAYDKALPELRSLRLCHRFGKGSDVHITKLPLEVRLVIEGHIAADERVNVLYWDHWNTGWKSTFEYFEGRCKPQRHAQMWDDRLMDWEDDIWDGVVQPCADCEAAGLRHYEACDSCQKAFKKELNESVIQQDGFLEAHEESAQKWSCNLARLEGGTFEYDSTLEFGSPMPHVSAYKSPLKVLKEEFGLEAYFATTRKAEGKDSRWTVSENHRFYDYEGLQTTICFLTLPRKSGPVSSFGASEIECDGGYASVTGFQASRVELPAQSTQERRSRQFHRAMSALGLRPYIHPSQIPLLSSTVSADGSSDAKEGCRYAADDLDKDGDGKWSECRIGSRLSNTSIVLSNVRWPQLLLLVEGTSSL